MTDVRQVRVFATSVALAFALVGCAGEDAALLAPEGPSDATIGVSAVTGAPASAVAGDGFVVMARGNSLPKNFEADVVAAGGEIVYSIPQIGAALVRGVDADFAAKASKIKGVESVFEDVVVSMTPTPARVAPEMTDDASAELADPPFTNINDAFFDLQWSMDAIDWTDAVEISDVRGQGVRVAILDSGILSTHNEFASNLNTALSTSFVPGELYDNPAGFHGTHVSGIVAAAQNDIGTIGVAPEVDLVSVKVLSGNTGGGSFIGIAAAMVYAADIEADVVNMSIGATLDHDGTVYNRDCVAVAQASAKDVAETINLLKRAAQYARNGGVTLIASAGNCGDDGDADKNRVHLPSDLPQVLSIAATGPEGWGLDPDTNLDRLASYSNFGRSVIDLAAPGGDFTLPGNDLCVVLVGPTDFPITRPCWVLDLVFSTSNSSPFSYAWTAGTSMASPAVAGVAALIVSKNGGQMSPARVEAALRKAVNFDDGGAEGQNGRTAFFGRGQVSALEALR